MVLTQGEILKTTELTFFGNAIESHLMTKILNSIHRLNTFTSMLCACACVCVCVGVVWGVGALAIFMISDCSCENQYVTFFSLL